MDHDTTPSPSREIDDDPVRSRGIADAHDRISFLTNRIREQLDELAKCLDPVMLPGPVPDLGEKEPSGDRDLQSPVATNLYARASELSSISARLSGLIRSVDV